MGARVSDAVLAVNGRFLRGQPTGLHRVARSLLGELRHRVPLSVIAPSSIEDVDIDWPQRSLRGRAGDHVWEQLTLPYTARHLPIVSFANTAPIAARRSAVMVHDLATRVGPQWFRRELRVYGALSLAAARRADVVLTVSEQIADELSAAGVRTDRIGIVRSAVAPTVAPASADDISAVRARFGLSRDYVLHVGWADPRKDAATLAAAHLRVAADHPHDLVLAGLAHRNFAPVNLPEGPSIRRVGFVSDSELNALLTGASVFAYPSRYEGFGLPPIEAMVCGTTVIVSDLPALRESTEGRATYVRAGDIDAWAAALRAALNGAIAPTDPPLWSWSDAGDQLMKALATLLD
jgi:glycosyltransferase involved in cell wall biosynthesis